MFCPQCGLKQISNEVRFCAGCGFQLSAVTGLLTTGGVVPRFEAAGPRKLSPRQRGIRQGAMLMLSTMLVVPLVAIIGVALLMLPGEIAGVAAVTCLIGGLLRIIYALMLEDREAPPAEPSQLTPYVPPSGAPLFMNQPMRGSALPPQSGVPVTGYRPPVGVNTGELRTPSSVTENTTRLLKDPPEEK
jgi:hypothetical protein